MRCVRPILAPHPLIFIGGAKGLLMAESTGGAPQTDLRKLPVTYWPCLEVGRWAHQSAGHYGPHHWPPPLARKLPGRSLWSSHMPELLERRLSCSAGPFDPCDDTCRALIRRTFVPRIMTCCRGVANHSRVAECTHLSPEGEY